MLTLNEEPYLDRFVSISVRHLILLSYLYLISVRHTGGSNVVSSFSSLHAPRLHLLFGKCLISNRCLHAHWHIHVHIHTHAKHKHISTCLNFFSKAEREKIKKKGEREWGICIGEVRQNRTPIGLFLASCFFLGKFFCDSGGA